MFSMLFQQAVENPTSTEIQDVCAAVGFNVLLEVTKTRPLPSPRQPNQNHKKNRHLGMCLVLYDFIFSYDRINCNKVFFNSQDIFFL